MKKNIANRREFIRNLSGAGLGLLVFPDIPAETKEPAPKKSSKIEEICVFSKHLQFLDYTEMAETAAELGFDGVDLTVRPAGHVLPENVVRDLPLAVKAVEEAGLKVPMMATAITDPTDETGQTVLRTASDLGIRHYRMGYLPYDFKKGISETLNAYKFWITGLIGLNKRYNIIGNYQNHEGINVGAPIWDLWELFRDHQPDWIGSQYDIRHATVEGGDSWPIDLQLISPYIQSLVIKDFKWGKINDDWVTINTPVGEGMVKFDKYFELIKTLGVCGPVTMHFEYPLTSKPLEQMDKKTAKSQVMRAMKKDFDTLKSMLKKAGLIS